MCLLESHLSYTYSFQKYVLRYTILPNLKLKGLGYTRNLIIMTEDITMNNDRTYFILVKKLGSYNLSIISLPSLLEYIV